MRFSHSVLRVALPFVFPIAAQASFLEITDGKKNAVTEFEVVTARPEQSPSDGKWGVAIHLDTEGTRLFQLITKNKMKQPLAVKIDGKEVMNPVVQTVIENGNLLLAQKFSHEEVLKMVEGLTEISRVSGLIEKNKFGWQFFGGKGGYTLKLIENPKPGPASEPAKTFDAITVKVGHQENLGGNGSVVCKTKTGGHDVLAVAKEADIYGPKDYSPLQAWSVNAGAKKWKSEKPEQVTCSGSH